MGRARYKAAIVGCGRIASLFADDSKRKGILTHAQAYQAHPSTRLVAACDLDQKRLLDFGRRWGVRGLYRDFDQMLRSERPDVLSVCTWNRSHAELVRSAVRHGVRGVICEKPISDSLKSAEQMLRSCRRRRVPLLINCFRRYNPLHQRIKSQIDRGQIGRIQAVSCYYTAGIANTGTHLFDLLRYFFGEVRWVWANPDRVLEGPDPTIDLCLFFEKGFSCTAQALSVKDYTIFEIDIYGTKGRIRIADAGMRAEYWKVIDHPVFRGYKKLEKERDLRTDFGKDIYRLVDDLVSAMETGSSPRCSGLDGKKSLEIVCAAHLSHKQKRRIALPLRDQSVLVSSK